MRQLRSIEVPQHLQRNASKIVAAGVEHTGEVLLNNLARQIGRPNLAALDILDLGCGVRFTQTLINRCLPFKSYTGIDVSLPVIQWLRDNVEAKDEKFGFSSIGMLETRCITKLLLPCSSTKSSQFREISIC